ncbi:MAG: hypothetical protein J6S72_05470, partial [Lachnospiraceae bacterium]|nr:hypothetical protein [Lachnospiraceae bacterium]
MAKNRMMILGPKESFIIRVLKKKVQDSGCECEYLPMTVDDINESLRGEEPLIALYLDEEVKPHPDVLHFLIDRMEEKDMQAILIGEADDLKEYADKFPMGLVYMSFERPVDNEGFVKSVKEYFKKLALGEFKKRI